MISINLNKVINGMIKQNVTHRRGVILVVAISSLMRETQQGSETFYRISVADNSNLSDTFLFVLRMMGVLWQHIAFKTTAQQMR